MRLPMPPLVAASIIKLKKRINETAKAEGDDRHCGWSPFGRPNKHRPSQKVKRVVKRKYSNTETKKDASREGEKEGKSGEKRRAIIKQRRFTIGAPPKEKKAQPENQKKATVEKVGKWNFVLLTALTATQQKHCNCEGDGW